jgi:hypothetical protein
MDISSFEVSHYKNVGNIYTKLMGYYQISIYTGKFFHKDVSIPLDKDLDINEYKEVKVCIRYLGDIPDKDLGNIVKFADNTGASIERLYFGGRSCGYNVNITQLEQIYNYLIKLQEQN